MYSFWNKFKNKLKDFFKWFYPSELTWNSSDRFINMPIDKKIEIAKSDTTSAEDLVDLAKDKDIDVVLAAAQNEKMPSDMLDQLTQRELIDQYNQKVDIIPIILKNPQTSIKTLMRFKKVDEYLPLVVQHPHITDAMLYEFIQSDNVQVKLNALDNPNIKKNTIQTLIKDENDDIAIKANQLYDQKFNKTHKEHLPIDEQIENANKIRNDKLNKSTDIQKGEKDNDKEKYEHNEEK